MSVPCRHRGRDAEIGAISRRTRMRSHRYHTVLTGGIAGKSEDLEAGKAACAELYDRFIDASRGDVRTLRHGALTCRAWLSRSSLNLYHSVLICRHHQINKLSRSLKSSELSALVKELVISPGRDAEGALVHNTFAKLARHQLQLNPLTLAQPRMMFPDYIDRTQLHIPPRVASLIGKLSATLTCLQLFDVYLSSVYDLTRLINVLPKLSALECRALEWERDDESISSDPPLREASCPNLEKLAVSGPWNMIPGASLLFEALNLQSLKHLDIDAVAASSTDEFEAFVESLQAYNALESLTFTNHHFPFLGMVDDMQHTVCAVLYATTSCPLKRVSLDFTHAFDRTRQDVVETAALLSSVLDEAFERPAFASVRFEVHVADNLESESWWRAELQSALPGLHARSVLDVIVCDRWGSHPTEEIRYEDGAV